MRRSPQAEKRRNYPVVPLSLAKKFESLARERGVSRVARGEVKSTQTDGGFFEWAKKLDGSVIRLGRQPVRAGSKQTWWQRRNAFCARHLAQQRKQDSVGALEKSGKYAGLPSRRELGLIMWMCSSLPLSKLREIGKKI